MKLPVINYDPRKGDFLWLSLLRVLFPGLLLSTAWGGMRSTSSGPHSRFAEGTESSDLRDPGQSPIAPSLCWERSLEL